jgi:N-acetylmuramoyl-L-alanine amidase
MTSKIVKYRVLKTLLAVAVLQTLAIAPVAAHGLDFRVRLKMQEMAQTHSEPLKVNTGDDGWVVPRRVKAVENMSMEVMKVISAMNGLQDYAAAVNVEPSARGNFDAKPKSLRLISAFEQEGKIMLNLSEEILAHGLGTLRFEQTLRNIHAVASESMLDYLGDAQDIQFETKINGRPLMAYLAEAGLVNEKPKQSFRESLLAQAGVSPYVPVRGTRITTSAGHGWTFYNGGWNLQRSYQSGIVEDFANFEFITLLDDKLRNLGALVRTTRNTDKNAGNGESGKPKWQEAARYHIKAQGAPATVYNVLNGSNSAGVPYDDYDNDIGCRPLYANWVDQTGFATNVLVSMHNNGGGGTGTETLYDTANGYQDESKKLADFVHNKIIAAIRKDFDPAWSDRKVKGFAGDYGENRRAKMPAILIEIAFMDTAKDNAAIQNATFREIVATAASQGITEYLANAVFVDSTAPTVPSRVVAEPFGATQINLSWAASLDDTGVTAYRVSRNGSLVGTTATPTYVDTQLTPETSYNYTIVAVDAAGNASAASTALSTRTLSATPQFRPIDRGTSQSNCWSLLDPKSPQNGKKCK